MTARVFFYAALAALALAVVLVAARSGAHTTAREGDDPPGAVHTASRTGDAATGSAMDADAARMVSSESPARLACVGAALTEIVFALGAGEQLVAVDDGSNYPPAASALPRLGYQRALSAEGLLSLRPTLVLAGAEAGPPAVLAQLRDAGLALHVVPTEHSLAGVEASIAAVARALGRDAQGAALIETLRADVSRAQAEREHARDKRSPPRVLCLYARGRGALHACGTGTALDAMVSLAGGVNALSGLSGSVPLGGEAAVAAAPDVVLVPRGSAELSGGVEGLLQEDGLSLTPAGRAGRVVVMDDQLLSGFGPRTGEALLQLVRALHR